MSAALRITSIAEYLGQYSQMEAWLSPLNGEVLLLTESGVTDLTRYDTFPTDRVRLTKELAQRLQDVPVAQLWTVICDGVFAGEIQVHPDAVARWEARKGSGPFKERGR